MREDVFLGVVDTPARVVEFLVRRLIPVETPIVGDVEKLPPTVNVASFGIYARRED